MATRYGKCSNIGNCDNADNKKVIEIFDGQDFICPEPECQQELIETFIKKKVITLNKILLFGSLIIVLGGIIWGVFAYMNFQKSKIKNIGDSLKTVAVENKKCIPKISKNDTVHLLLTEANLMFSNKDYENAKLKYQRILTLDPINENAKNQLLVIDKILLPPPPPPPPPTKEGKIYKKLKFDYGYYEGFTLNNLRDGQGTMFFTKRQIISPNDPRKRYAENGEKVSGTWVEGNIVNGKHYNANGDQIETLFIGH